jgi:hypothetical protein
LNFDKRPEFAIVTDLTTIQIHELRQLDVLANLDVARDASEVVHA